MDERTFRQLIDRYINGLATDEEIEAVEAFFDGYRKDAKDWPEEVMGAPEESEKLLLAEILLKEKIHNERKKRTSRTFWRVAASLLILIGVGYGAYVHISQVPAEPVATALNAGGDKAILKLADGTEFALDSMSMHVIPQQGDVRVVNKNGRLSYESTAPGNKMVYNAITTPRGGQYQIDLADGSRVWLNSVSSLRYPAAFSGAERVVELTGEAYFEVARNTGKPFKVLVNSSKPGEAPFEVLVLGTHFNVMAYPEEGTIATTLIEGAVQIGRGSERAKLQPGEQAHLTTGSTLDIRKDIDLRQAIAWKEGRFIFNDTPLEVIMRQVSRWYDVEVIFRDDVGSLQFGGVVSRKEDATAILHLLKLTGEVDFDVQGRQVFVRGPNR